MADKLVRDLVPRFIVDNTPSTVKTYVASTFEFHRRIRENLSEETEELLSASSDPLAKGHRVIAECVDVLEVVYAIANFYGIEVAHLEEQRLLKRNIKGGFASRIVMEIK